MVHKLWIFLAILVLVACTDDVSSSDGGMDAGDDAATGGDGDGGDGDGDGDGDEDAGTGGMGGDGDAGDGDAGDGDAPGDGDGDGDIVDNGIPQDGSSLSTCHDDEDCTGDLVCYQAQGSNTVGFCTQACPGGDDKLCDNIGGVYTTCGSNNQCRVDCTDDMDGTATDGVCPTDMECVGVGFSQERCTYPEDAAAVLKQWAVCDTDLMQCSGDTTCAGATLLGLPTPGDILFGASSGICTTSCTGDDECTDDGGLGGTAQCTTMGGLLDRYCVISCESDAECPGDMECVMQGLIGPGTCGY